MIKINKLAEFVSWLESLTIKEQTKVESRLERIEKHGHFGDAKGIDDGLAELRWKNGWRVYFIKENISTILLLSGGHKNAQKKDIKQARLLARRYF
jgi:putative addiction module killer protein